MKWRNPPSLEYGALVPRSGAEARARLQAAALALFAAHGYDGTTTAEIAAAAGVNLRTFFRHFADKREVLFGGQEEAAEALSRAVLDAPGGLAPAGVLLHAFLHAAGAFVEDADATALRLRVIAASPALHERDLAKGAILTATIRAALEHRGLPVEVARLIALVGYATYQQAASEWSAGPGRSFEQHLRGAFADLGRAAEALAAHD